MKDNKTLVFFDKNCNDALYIVQLNKSVKKLKFDRKKSRKLVIKFLSKKIIYDTN